MNRLSVFSNPALKRGLRAVGLAARPLAARSSILFYRSNVPLNRYFHASLCRNEESDKTDNKSQHLGSFKVDKPMLMIAFTCKKCNTRSSHTMSKQAYTKGTVLITCPGCKNRHLIADHLKIFNDNHITIEDIMKAQGQSVSLTTDDLAFEDVPDSLKNVIGHYAKDAPDELKKKLDNEKVHELPEGTEK